MWKDDPGFVAHKKEGDRTVLMLTNFPVGGQKLQPDHITALDTLLVPVLMNAGSASVVGLASTTGSDARNKSISQNRAVAVVDWLMGRCGNNLNIREIFAHGEAFAKAVGVADGEESPWFRSVVITYWSNPVPPSIDPSLPNIGPLKVVPPGISGPGAVSLAVDLLGGAEMLWSLGLGAAAPGLVTAGGFFLTIIGPSVSGIAMLADAEQLIEFNGFCEGFFDAYQAMTKRYNGENLRYLPLSKWPPLIKPALTRPKQIIVGRWADVANKAYVKGVNDAYETVRNLDRKPKKQETIVQGKKVQVEITSRVYLRVLWLQHRLSVADAVRKEVNRELLKRGESPYPRLR